MEPWLQAWLWGPMARAPHSSTGPPIPARSRSHPLYGALHSSGGRCGPENEEAAAQGRVLPGPTDLGAEAGDRGRDGAGARGGGREIRRNVSYQRQLSMSVIKCRLGSKPLSVSRFRFQMQRLRMESTELRDLGWVCVLERKLCSPDVPHKPRRCGRPGGQGRGSHEVRAGPEDFRSRSRGGKKAAVGRGTGQAAGAAVCPHLPLVDCSRAPRDAGRRVRGPSLRLSQLPESL